MRMKNAAAVAVLAAMCAVGWAQIPGQSPERSRQPTRIRVSAQVLESLATKKVMPQPPWTTDKQHESGMVMLNVLVGRDGFVSEVHFSGGDSILGEVAERAVRQWQFRPFVVAGTRVFVQSTITMKFSKNRAEVVLR